jgi:hypothetical protein
LFSSLRSVVAEARPSDQDRAAHGLSLFEPEVDKDAAEVPRFLT